VSEKYDAIDLVEYLGRRKIPFQVNRHPSTVTAAETAEAQHISGKHFANNACSHEHTITTSGQDFLKAAEAVVGDCSADPVVPPPRCKGG